MHDERKTIRFTPAQMLEIQRQAHKDRRQSVSDMVRLLTVEAVIERERKILNDLIAEFGTDDSEVLKQSERLDDLINKL